MFQKVQSGSTEDSKLEGSKSGCGVPLKKLLYSSRQNRMVTWAECVSVPKGVGEFERYLEGKSPERGDWL